MDFKNHKLVALGLDLAPVNSVDWCVSSVQHKQTTSKYFSSIMLMIMTPHFTPSPLLLKHCERIWFYSVLLLLPYILLWFKVRKSEDKALKIERRGLNKCDHMLHTNSEMSYDLKGKWLISLCASIHMSTKGLFSC